MYLISMINALFLINVSISNILFIISIVILLQSTLPLSKGQQSKKKQQYQNVLDPVSYILIYKAKENWRKFK